MSFAFVYVLTQVFVPLIIVVLLVASRRHANGPLMACAALAILSFAALWLFSDSQYGLLVFFAGPQDNATSLRFVLYAVSNVGGQAAWVLALYPAALARQTRWLSGLAAAQVVASAVLLLASNPCLVAEATNNLGTNGCEPLAPLTLHLISAAWLVSPAVALAYALRTRRVAPPLNPPSDPATAPFSGAAEDDGELEVRTERL